MRKIKIITVLGGNGRMGSSCAAIFAGFGDAKVYLLSRDLEKSKSGVENAIKSIKSHAVRRKLIPGTYKKDLRDCLAKSDWVFEAVSEDYQTKQDLYKEITGNVRKGTIISTCSSGLSIDRLSRNFDKKESPFFFGVHFFNPPYKMILCELISHKKANRKAMFELGEYLEKVLARAVIYTHDTPGYAANRIGFQLMSEVVQFAERYKNQGGIALMDKIVGRYTGRVMPPLATLDFVGLDIYKAIVVNLYNNTRDNARSTFKIPSFVEKLISQKKYGIKSSAGFFQYLKSAKGKNETLVYNIVSNNYGPCPKYKIPFIDKAKDSISKGDYLKSMKIIKEAKGFEAQIARHFIARYLSYSLSMVGEVVDSKEMVDMAMAYGFHWVPPSAMVDFLGGACKAIKFIESANLPVPAVLKMERGNSNFYKLQGKLDARSFLRS